MNNQITINKDIAFHWLDNFLSRTSNETFLNDIDAEIEGMKGTISNEEIWMIGSRTIEQQAMHHSNIETIKKYIDILEKIKELSK